MKERFTITIEAPKGERPGVVRLRRLLKTLLRRYGLKCCEVRREKPGDPPRGG